MTKKFQTEKKSINPQVEPLEAKIGPYNTHFNFQCNVCKRIVSSSTGAAMNQSAMG